MLGEVLQRLCADRRDYPGQDGRDFPPFAHALSFRKSHALLHFTSRDLLGLEDC